MAEDYRRVRIFIEGVAEEPGQIARLHTVSGAFVLLELEPVTSRQRANPLLDEVPAERTAAERLQAQAVADARVARMPREIRAAAAKIATTTDRRIDLDERKK